MQRFHPPRLTAQPSPLSTLLTSLHQLRPFSTHPAHHAKSAAKRLAFEHEGVPPYPHGPSLFYKQSNFGLYGSAKIRFGNKVSKKNEIKTRRFWRPNVKRKRLWSNALNAFVRTRITTRMLRTVDKAGGLDEYLLGDSPGRIRELGMGGWKLRWRVMQTEAVKERFRLQREKLGLPPKDGGEMGVDGLPASAEMVADQVRAYDEALRSQEAEVGIGEDLVVETDGEHQDAAPFMEEEPVKQPFNTV